MIPFRIALANLPFPETPGESVVLAIEAIVEASDEGAGIICFPECFMPGYRGLGMRVPPPDAAFLDRAWSTIAAAAAKARVAVVLGTERLDGSASMACGERDRLRTEGTAVLPSAAVQGPAEPAIFPTPR